MANRNDVIRCAWIFVVLAVSLTLLAGCQQPQPAAETGGGFLATRIAIAKDEYPRAFFFRSSETLARDPEVSYEEWARTFDRLMGIMGKALDEEFVNTQWRNLEFFTRFKRENPDQLVMLHYNGNARDPRYEAEAFFAGHWIYFNGCKILADVPAESGETEIRVEDAGLFKMNVGRGKDKHEDIGLCLLDENGKPNWRRSEQVELIGVDRTRNTIRVKRSSFGTAPMAFPAGKAYAAAHVYEGPWGENSNLMWFYNFSPVSPRDEQGRTASDVLLADLVKRFSPGGELELFDGLEFDVMFFVNTYHPDVENPEVSGRGLDADADGKIDQGRVDGKEAYGIGVIEFLRALRERFPQDKILMSDGHNRRSNQRAFRILNGMESEGFPNPSDVTMRDWSGGLNRILYWARNSRPPVFHYINHAHDPRPFGVHRLVFAAGVFTDAAICYSIRPEPEPGERIGIWDELQMGTERKLLWLGKAVGPPVKLAEKEADLLGGQGSPASAELVKKFSGAGVDVALEGGSVKITGKNSKARGMKWRLAGVPAQGPDLFLTLTVRGAQWTGYPPETARLMLVNVAGAGLGPFRAWAGNLSSVEGVPMIPTELGPFMTWAGSEDFTAGFYFSDVSGDAVDLEFEIEGTEAVWLSDIRVYAHQDVMCREFERGLVLANPSPRPYTFNLAQLAPGKSYRRLQGSPAQDPATNNGADVGGTLELPAKDAIFLVAK